MTQPLQPTEPFAQHPRLAELVNGLHFRRYPLFLAGLLHEEAGGPLRLATAVASRDGDLLAYDGGEVFEHAGRVPASRLFDDDVAERSEKTRVDALADLNRVFFAHEVAAWTRGRRSVNEVGIGLLHHWFVPEEPPPAITRSEVLGVVPASWSSRSWSCSRPAEPGRFKGMTTHEEAYPIPGMPTSPNQALLIAGVGALLVGLATAGSRILLGMGCAGRRGSRTTRGAEQPVLVARVAPDCAGPGCGGTCRRSSRPCLLAEGVPGASVDHPGEMGLTPITLVSNDRLIASRSRSAR
jgi:hypothetical protein